MMMYTRPFLRPSGSATYWQMSAGHHVQFFFLCGNLNRLRKAVPVLLVGLFITGDFFTVRRCASAVLYAMAP